MIFYNQENKQKKEVFNCGFFVVKTKKTKDHLNQCKIEKNYIQND